MNTWTVSWTNAALVSGVAALIVPYVVHLLTRRAPVALVFPTIEFLKKARANQSSIFRLREIILLLVRTGLIALLLLAFLKPVLRNAATNESVVRRQAAVIVVDASLSMQCGQSGETPFARAKRAADNLLDKLSGECRLNLIVAGASPTISLDTPAQSVVPLKRDIQDAAPTLERADMDAAIDAGLRQQLEALPEFSRTIYIVSDFQRTNWTAVKFESVPEDVKLALVPVGDTVAANCAITDIVVRPRTPVVTEIVEIVCTVANYGASRANVPLTLHLDSVTEPVTDDASELRRDLAIEPGASTTTTFRMRATKSGAFEGTARISDDALGADNARYFAMEIQKQIDVIVASDAAAEPRAGAHFLARALNPFGGDETTLGAGGSMVRTKVLRGRELNLDSSPPQVLLLDGVGTLGANTAEDIARYLAAGGACIYFLADALDKSNLDAIAAATKDTFVLPFSLKSIIDRRTLGEFSAKFGEANFDDLMLRHFKESRDLSELSFYKYFSTEREQGRGKVLLRYDDGNYALGEATLGAGSMLLCNFSASRDASDLAQRPAFIPLIYELVKNMRPRESAMTRAVVGYTASGSVSVAPNASGYTFNAPDGTPVGATSERHSDHLAVILPTTRQPGFYRVLEGPRHIGSIPVNVDARESDLQPLNESQLASLAAAPARKLAVTSGGDMRAVRRLVDGISLWQYLLLAALCMLGVEQLVLIALRR